MLSEVAFGFCSVVYALSLRRSSRQTEHDIYALQRDAESSSDLATAFKRPLRQPFNIVAGDV